MNRGYPFSKSAEMFIILSIALNLTALFLDTWDILQHLI